MTDEELLNGRESWKELEDPMFDGMKLWDLKDLLAYEETDEEVLEDACHDHEDEDVNNDPESHVGLCQELNQTCKVK